MVADMVELNRIFSCAYVYFPITPSQEVTKFKIIFTSSKSPFFYNAF